MSRIETSCEQAKVVIGRCLEARANHELLFSQNLVAPEAAFIEKLRDYAAKIQDESFTLNALSLACTLVLSEKTSGLFKRLNRLDFNEHGWVFEPSMVVLARRSGINVRQYCKEHLKPGGYSVRALDQWVHNCEVIYQKYGGDIRNFLADHGNDAVKVMKGLRGRPRAKTIEKDEFRRFGDKIARLYVQWVCQYGLYPLENADGFGLPVDVHLSRILVQTGCVRLEQSENHFQILNAIQTLISVLCQRTGWRPQEISETLWLLGSEGCSKSKRNLCPVQEYCQYPTVTRGYYKSKMVTLENPADYLQSA
jgi:hypothetical protein